MKKLMTLALAAGMLFGIATGASAIDFKAKGQWLMGFGVGEDSLVQDEGDHDADTDDMFYARQRIRLQLDAVASEALSGTVYFEIGTTDWGKADNGGALGADANDIIKVKRAYIDWLVPNTDLKFRMGLQGVQLPNKAGGSAVMDTDVAGITASYAFNENVALTALWARPFNDNYAGYNKNGVSDTYRANYLDNMDLFALMVDLKFDGVQATPWIMYGMAGKNVWENMPANDGNPYTTMGVFGPQYDFNYSSNAYGSMFWAGLPVAITLWDPLNIEFDINYGYVESYGRASFENAKNNAWKRGNTQRQGWLAKALVEYKMDWGVPGIFGWYASGDDGDVKNGSERMPSVVPCGNFTSFMGDGNYGWTMQDYNLSYAGTWGIGLQIRDMSFIEDLKHTFRVAYWGGTNSTSMVKYSGSSIAWNYGGDVYPTGPYLTTNDGLLEFNLVNNYQIYENLEANLELSYIVNMMDQDTWRHSTWNNKEFSKQDMWKAQVTFAYSF
ncbi:outer membrane homotrimeric porin [uncultured Desulfovibrio sp.]|uniref:outer membrane homotrimeric porin n=1 Tax=uncultured Desulfovibrio sp. TaxID=167968 RepID=UPI0026359F01|nr:outer membrane homotrimeric porin [uncultured Desulfovibrio sp.]